MDERGVYDDTGINQTAPTVAESGPAGGGTVPGLDIGGLKRDPISSSPTIGHTIAGRNLNGEPVREGEPEEPGGGSNTEDNGHLDRE